jgi:hypothetical protein
MSIAVEPKLRQRCVCGHELQVFGRGRHRVYFELTDTAFTGPVMSGVCPDCHRPLAGNHVA